VILAILLRPPGAPPDEKPSSAPELGRRVLPVTRQRARRYNRVISVSIIASVLLHILFIRLSPLVVRYLEPDVGLFPTRPVVRVSPQGMRALEIRVTESAPVEVTPEPQPEPVELEPGEVVEEVGPVPSAVERLRPRVGDWRLWVVPAVRRPRDLTAEERAAQIRARLYAQLEAFDDSVAAELARELDRLDWTVGEEGNKWGVSPGQLHLGPITLPLPLGFAPHPATQRELADQAAEWDAIRRQAGQAVIEETFEERVRAIRERRERERAEQEAQRDTTGGGG